MEVQNFVVLLLFSSVVFSPKHKLDNGEDAYWESLFDNLNCYNRNFAHVTSLGLLDPLIHAISAIRNR